MRGEGAIRIHGKHRRGSQIIWWRGCAKCRDGAGFRVTVRDCAGKGGNAETSDRPSVAVRIRADAHIVTEVGDGAAGSIGILDDADLCLCEGRREGEPGA